MRSNGIKFSSCISVFIFYLVTLSIPVKAQSNTDGSTPQFLFPDFNTGKILMKNGKTQSISLNYNTVTERIVYEKDDIVYDLVNPEMTDTVYIEDHKFVPAGKVFYDVLFSSKIPFFVQHQGKIIPPGTPAGYGGTSQVSNTKYMSSVGLDQGYYNLKLPSDILVKVDLIYWIRKDGNMLSFINERQFIKLFPDKETQLKQFIKQNRIKFDNPESMIKLAKYFNEAFQ